MDNLFNQIANFYNHPLFIIVGGITVTIAFIAFIYRLTCWTFGITPIVFAWELHYGKERLQFLDQSRYLKA